MSSSEGRSGSRLDGLALRSQPRADSAWRRFRRWPVWGQVLGWTFGFVVLLPILIWRSTLGAKAKVLWTTALLVVVVAALVSPASGKQKGPNEASALIPSSTSPPPSVPTTPTYTNPTTLSPPPPSAQPLATPAVSGITASNAKSILDSF